MASTSGRQPFGPPGPSVVRGPPVGDRWLKQETCVFSQLDMQGVGVVSRTFPGFAHGAFVLLGVFSDCVHADREHAGVSSSSYKNTSPPGLGPHPYDLIKLTFLKVLSPNRVPLRVRASIYEFGMRLGAQVQFITLDQYLFMQMCSIFCLSLFPPILSGHTCLSYCWLLLHLDIQYWFFGIVPSDTFYFILSLNDLSKGKYK